MYFRQLLNDETACASYLLGFKTHGAFAVVDPHVDLVEDYVALADAQGAAIVAVLETHVQADHVSGLPALVARTGATAYLPQGAGAGFAHHALRDGDVVTLGNTELEALATPGHALAHQLSANPISTVGFERRHNRALRFGSEDAFAGALTRDIPPPPAQQAAIVTANRTGRPLAEVA